jgi:hypothetical protein
MINLAQRKILNKSSPKAQPCGTPEKTGKEEDSPKT